jgi:hypothetical protein
MAFVLEPTVEVIYHFEDYNGARASMKMFMINTDTDPATGAPANLAASLQSISDCQLTNTEILIHSVNDTPGTPTDGPYARGADKALMEFGSADGTIVKIQIGAPNETHLDANHLTYSTADSAVLALQTAMVAHAVTAEGSAITHFQRGYRRRPSHRKGK